MVYIVAADILIEETVTLSLLLSLFPQVFLAVPKN
jgi:hypothetical protein